MGGGEISIDQFVNTLRSLSGDARAKESFAFTKRLQRLITRTEALIKDVQADQRQVQELTKDMRELGRAIGRNMINVQQFCMSINRCIPKDSASVNAREIKQFHDEFRQKIQPAMHTSV
eukprot:TRINITY_DN36013_c0_g1_i2.p1 TRINITY_DN36013_c0_g1~~TRINITY_DN36013_c0_g1_i2.p1  ORF type:complete len:119 (+),score=17.43 TRINITY_DN36013_c0_g1_i2:239-595(+)